MISRFGLPQRLQVPIDTHQRHSEHLAELSLCEWQRASVCFHESDKFGSIELLAKEMRNACGSMSTTVVGNGLAEDRRIF